MTPFKSYKGKARKSGTGGIYEINDHLFEGRYTPTNAHGKREARNVYAKTKEKCAELLDAMIEQVRAQIAEEKAAIKAAADAHGQLSGAWQPHCRGSGTQSLFFREMNLRKTIDST